MLFKKKEKVVENAKFKEGDIVLTMHNGDFVPARVMKVYQEKGLILCDISIGGECPIEIKHIKEVFLVKKK